ncbi:MAG: hypothetical protein M1817_004146 [Caeruleum heppii]|nr:MAG: hypothetical protein M1817_004146 [Caeruleum heppii]
MASTTTTHPTFWHLPSEIRNEIYRFVLVNRLTEDYLANPEQSLLLVNRAVHNEASVILYEEATFSTCCGTSNVTPLGTPVTEWTRFGSIQRLHVEVDMADMMDEIMETLVDPRGSYIENWGELYHGVRRSLASLCRSLSMRAPLRFLSIRVTEDRACRRSGLVKRLLRPLATLSSISELWVEIG